MADTVRTRHKISGVIDENTPRHIAEHEVLGEHLEIVGPNAKPYLPEMHRVSLPENPTADQIAVAESVGAVEPGEVLPAPAAELHATIAAERAKASKDTPDKIGKD